MGRTPTLTVGSRATLHNWVDIGSLPAGRQQLPRPEAPMGPGQTPAPRIERDAARVEVEMHPELFQAGRKGAGYKAEARELLRYITSDVTPR